MSPSNCQLHKKIELDLCIVFTNIVCEFKTLAKGKLEIENVNKKIVIFHKFQIIGESRN